MIYRSRQGAPPDPLGGKGTRWTGCPLSGAETVASSSV